MVNNQPFDLGKEVNDIYKIELKYRDNNIILEYAVLNDDSTYQYAHRIKKIEKQWSNLSDTRKVIFSNIPSGHYTLEVKAVSQLNTSDEKIIGLDLYIHPPYWKTWWFQLLLTGLVGLVIYGIFRIRVGIIRREEAIKTEFNKKLAQVEMQALRAQMNPHFLFNSLNSIKYYIVNKSVDKATDYLDNFSRLIRLILDNSRHQLIPLSKELEALTLYIGMEQIRFEKKFEYSITVEEAVDTDFIQLPPLLLQPYVENAIWHGLMRKETDDGQLTIEVLQEDTTIFCIIEDNGIGRERANQLKSKSALKKKSLGMQITRDRMEMNNQLNGMETEVEVIDLKDEAGQAMGTRVVVRIRNEESDTLEVSDS